MSLSGIFDPVVRAYFENKYANSGGGTGGDTGGGTVETGLCVSNQNTLVLELKPSILAGLETCEIDGFPYYKLSEDGSYANSIPETTVVLYQEYEGTGVKNNALGQFINGGGYMAFIESPIDLSNYFWIFDYKDGCFSIQYEGYWSNNQYYIAVLGTQEAATAFGAPSPGVYVSADIWDDAYSDRLVLVKHPME